MRCFGSTRAPPNGGGRPRSITPFMLNALCDRLIEKPCMYQDEMVVFLWDEFEILVPTHSISRALASIRWSNKTARRVAKERNADLRDLYLHKLSAFRSYQLVYIDESGCDKRIGFRRTGWSPLGVTPVQIAKFHRGRRYQILPAYAQDGIMYSRIFQGSTDGDVMVWVDAESRCVTNFADRSQISASFNPSAPTSHGPGSSSSSSRRHSGHHGSSRSSSRHSHSSTSSRNGNDRNFIAEMDLRSGKIRQHVMVPDSEQQDAESGLVTFSSPAIRFASRQSSDEMPVVAVEGDPIVAAIRLKSASRLFISRRATSC
ncbi:hypothetical protein PG995_005146 [Apiospora arundinis]